MLRKLLLTVGIVTLLASPAMARVTRPRPGGGGGGGAGGKGVPKFSGQAAGAGMALLAGGMLVLGGRRRRAKA